MKQELEDRMALKDLVDRYATESDKNNQDYYREIFRPDVKLKVYFGEKLGMDINNVEDMIAQYKAFGAAKASFHQNGQQVVDFVAQALGLDIIDADYDHEAWRCAVRGLEGEPERGGRCLQCFRLRLRDTARYAHEHGFTVITTTLASSRWKSLDQINEAGRYAVEPYPDVTWWDKNWRKGGLSERRIQIIKEYDFYNQQYCGCEFSMRKEEENTP